MNYSAQDYQLIALDLDGTTLNSKHQLSDPVRNALQEAAGEGLHIVLVSARAPRSVHEFSDRIGLAEPYIALNGALVLSSTGEFISRASIRSKDIHTILDLSRNHELVANLYSGFDWYVENMDPMVENESEILGFVPTVAKLPERLYSLVEKVLVMGLPVRAKRLYEELCAQDMDLNLSFSKPEYLEMTRGGVTKETGLVRLCRDLQIPASKVIAIGDNFNDIEMLKYAGLGIVVMNAPEPVKRVADLVIPGNDHDGVSIFIRQLLGNK